MIGRKIIGGLTAIVFLLSLGISGCGKGNEGDEHINEAKKIVAYYPNWGAYAGHQSYGPRNIPWDKVTHINYAFATIKEGKIALIDEWADLSLKLDTGGEGVLKQFKALKGKHPAVKALISVGGWTQSGRFHDTAATEESRKVFAESCVNFIREWDFDGVDIDWEYPTVKREPDTVDNKNDQGTPKADASEKETYTLLLKALREELDAAGEKDGKRYLLTVAVGVGKNHIDGTNPGKYSKYVDFINLMTYDMSGAWMKITAHQSPLRANPEEPDSSELVQGNNIEDIVKLMRSKKVPGYKLVIGAPYYSRGWKGVKNDGPIKELPGLYATAEGGADGIWDGGSPAGNNPFYYIREVMEKDPEFKIYRDPYSKAPYLYSESKQEMYTYEDEISLQEKVDYVNENGYGGIIFWEVTADYPAKGGTTLTDIIYNGFYGKGK